MTSQHRLLILEIQVRNWKRKNHIKQNPRIRWWDLKEKKQLIFKKKLRGRREWNGGQTNQMWREIASILRSTSNGVLEETNGRSPNLKKFWWWNEEVQLKIRNKKTCYKVVYRCSSEKNLKNYKEAKR